MKFAKNQANSKRNAELLLLRNYSLSKIIRDILKHMLKTSTSVFI